MSVPVITIDGPSGTGKGTLALRLTRILNWHLLDSGALYRVLAYAAVCADIALSDEAALAATAQRLPVVFSEGKSGVCIELDGVDVTDNIRSEAAGSDASVVAAIPAVRQALLSRQRDFRKAPGLVADGRDMGTVVFPDANLKIFLTASPERRAQRRYKQLKQKGISVNLARLLEDIAERDRRDEQRAVSPSKPAPDAITIDTTALGAAEVESEVFGLIKQRGIA